MKKAFLFVMMLLSFAAMAIGASFTNPPPDERDDGVSCVTNQSCDLAGAELQLQTKSGDVTYSLFTCCNLVGTTPESNLQKDFTNTTATTRIYWPTGNSKAYKCGLESISYTTKSIAPTSYNSEWPTACSIARTCGGLLEVANYNPAPAPLSMPLG